MADQISDAVLDKIIAFDPEAKVACETLVTTGQTIVAGEIKTDTYVDIQRIAREVINNIGYTKSDYMFDGNSCGVLSAIHEQSPDINRGVVREDPMEQGAGVPVTRPRTTCPFPWIWRTSCCGNWRRYARRSS